MNPPTPAGDNSGAAGAFARAVLDALPDATALLDQFGTIVSVNLAWRMFAVDNGGRPEDTGVGVSYVDVCRRAAARGCEDAADVLVGLEAVLAGATVESDHEYPCPSPTVGRWFTSRITPIRHPSGGAVVAHVNISRQKLSEQELDHLASHDSLTGLANRRLFNDRLGFALRAAQGRPDLTVGLLYIDLDDFKPVNDTYGHDAGDEVLLLTAHRLRQTVRPRDTVARLGGDEFAVCAPAIAARDLTRLADRLRAALAQPHQIHGHESYVRGSIGVHQAAPGDSVADTIRAADQAMYAVKNARALARR
jgi:diguanylate cyclase (GGDEF)-like protein